MLSDREFSSRDLPRNGLDPKPCLDSKPTIADDCLVRRLIEDTETLSTTSSEQNRLLTIARKANLKHFLTIDIPDVLVQSSLASGQDPCTTAQDFIDNTILQWMRRRGLKPSFIRVCEGVRPADPNLRGLNPLHGLHAHLLISHIPPEHYSEFLVYLGGLSNKLEHIAADAAGRPPRRPWGAGHVELDDSGVPIHIKPATSLDGAIGYMLKHLASTTTNLTALMRFMSKNRRKARPLFLSSDLRRLSI